MVEGQSRRARVEVATKKNEIGVGASWAKIRGKIRTHALWDTVKGPPPNLKGKTPFTPYSGFTLGTIVYTHYTTARQRYSPA